MSTRKTTVFYVLLSAVASFAVALVLASRFEMTPSSSAQTVNVPSMNSAPISGPIDALTFRNIAKAQSPMVVNIRTEMRTRTQDLSDFFGGGGGAPDDFFRRFFGPGGGGGPGGQDDQDQAPNNRGRRPREQKTQAAGTGFVIAAKDGFILTNNHVVDDATKIEVQFLGDEDDDTYAAKVIGKDALTDSALIQLIDRPSHPLMEAKFGDSSQMAAGDWVMAIGNPFGYAHTVTVGIISAMARPFYAVAGRSNEMIQTDAAINPGNSGGPLLNVRGEVIGINTAIISSERGGNVGNIGIGFAVPINAVRELLPQLHQGKVVRGRIGVQVIPVPRDGFEDYGLKSRMGAVVQQVPADGASAKAGVLPGDVIIEYNGRPVPNSSELVKMVIATKPGTSVPIKVLREKQEKTLHVTVEELDLDAEQQTLRSGRRNDGGGAPTPEEQGATGFGLTLQNLTPQMARRLQVPSGQMGAVITDVDPNSDSARSLRPGDVILSVNGKSVATAVEASRELAKVAASRIARLLVWRDGNEQFVPVRKE